MLYGCTIVLFLLVCGEGGKQRRRTGSGRREGPQTQKQWGGSTKGGRHEGWGARRWRGPKFRVFFFLHPPQIVLSSLCGVLSRKCGRGPKPWCTQKCTLRLLGGHCVRAPVAGAIPRQDTQRREKKGRSWRRERGTKKKKCYILRGPAEGRSGGRVLGRRSGRSTQKKLNTPT